MKTKTKAAPSRKERKLQREVTRLGADLAQSNLDGASSMEVALRTAECAEYHAHRAGAFQTENAALQSANAALQSANAHLEHTRRIAADSLLLERDELLVRVRRIEFRIQGLGFNV